MLTRRFVLFGTGSVLLAACATDTTLTLAPNSTLWIVRHADRLDDQLSDTGLVRARSMVDVMADAPLDAIYSRELQRNRQTAEPLAAARGLPIESVLEPNPTQRLITLGAGRDVIWIGNKGNLRAIWDSLGLPGDAPLEYGELAAVSRDGNGPMTVSRRAIPV